MEERKHRHMKRGIYKGEIEKDKPKGGARRGFVCSPYPILLGSGGQDLGAWQVAGAGPPSRHGTQWGATGVARTVVGPAHPWAAAHLPSQGPSLPAFAAERKQKGFCAG